MDYGYRIAIEICSKQHTLPNEQYLSGLRDSRLKCARVKILQKKRALAIGAVYARVVGIKPVKTTASKEKSPEPIGSEPSRILGGTVGRAGSAGQPAQKERHWRSQQEIRKHGRAIRQAREHARFLGNQGAASGRLSSLPGPRRRSRMVAAGQHDRTGIPSNHAKAANSESLSPTKIRKTHPAGKPPKIRTPSKANLSTRSLRKGSLKTLCLRRRIRDSQERSE